MRSLVVLVAACGGPQRPETPPCSAENAVVLKGQDDVERAAGCLTIASLAIRTGAPLDLTPLAKLHVVLGAVTVGPSVAFEDLRLPELHSVGSLAIAGNGNLHGVFLPRLVSAGSVSIAGNVALTTISLPKLARVTGDVTIRDGADLELVSLGALGSIDGALVVENNPRLTLLELEALERAKAVTITNNPVLAADVVDAVKAKAL